MTIMSNAVKEFSSGLENSIVAVTRSVLFLTLVNEFNLDKLADSIKEMIGAAHANGAVDVAIFVSYSDLHAFRFDGFFSAGFQLEIIGYSPVEFSYILICEDGSFQCASPFVMSYVRKFFSSVPA